MIIASSKMRNIILEKSILASAFIYPDCLNDMTRLLTERDFTTASNQAFFGELAKCSRKGYVPEVSLMMPKINESLHDEILSDIFGGGISSSNTITKMCHKLREVTICREFVEKAEMACIRASTGVDDYQEFTAEMISSFNGVNALVGKKGFRHVSEFAKDAWREVEEIKRGTTSGIKTGNPDIDKHVNGFKGGELVIIAARPAEGKALANSTLIPVPSIGEIKMGELSVGDYVFGDDGNPTKVIGVYPQGEKQMYSVIMSNGVRVYADIDHNWSVRKRTTAKFEVMTTREILEWYNGDVKIPSNRKALQIKYTKPVEYEKQNVEFSAWLIGFLIGDGCSTRFSFSSAEDDIIERVSEYATLKQSSKYDFSMSKNLPLRKYIQKDKKIGSHSYNKFVPKEYMFNSSDVRLEVLQGILDSDGHVQKCGNTIDYSTASKQLAEDVIFLVRSLGGRCTMVEKDTHYAKNGERFQSLRSYRLRLSFCNGIVPVSSKKHLRRYKGTIKKSTYTIVSVEKSHIESATCITVDNDSHLFLCNDFTVTHNTSLALTWAVHQLSQQGKKIGIISMEMSGKELLLKELCLISKALQGESDVYVPNRKMRNAEEFSEKEQSAMKRAQLYLNSSSLYIDDTAALTMTEIESSARMLHRQKGLDILYVDYVGLISSESTRDDRHKHIQDCSLRLKRLARELDIPVVMVVQLNRDAANKRPHMSNLAESSQLERDADFIFLIYTPDTENKGVKIVINDKCRSLPGEDYYCNFCTDTTLFTAMTHEGAEIVKQEMSYARKGGRVDAESFKKGLDVW